MERNLDQEIPCRRCLLTFFLGIGRSPRAMLCDQDAVQMDGHRVGVEIFESGATDRRQNTAPVGIRGK